MPFLAKIGVKYCMTANKFLKKKVDELVETFFVQ